LKHARGLLNNDELEKAAAELDVWLERDRKKFIEEQRRKRARVGNRSVGIGPWRAG